MTPDELIRAYEAAARAHDLERTLELVDDSAVYWFSNGTCHIGKDAIRRTIRANFEAIEGEDYRIRDIAWLVRSPDCAVCTYGFEWSGIVHGERASGSGRGTAVLARRGDSWAVVHEHLSTGPTA